VSSDGEKGSGLFYIHARVPAFCQKRHIDNFDIR
jgi:hypothetical protein